MTKPISHVQAVSAATLFLAALLAVLAPQSATAQGDRVLRPGRQRLTLGAELGGSYGFSTGSFVTTCNCSYSNGYGIAPYAGVFIDLPVSSVLRVTATASYAGSTSAYSAVEDRLEYIEAAGEYVTVRFERDADVSISHASLAVGAVLQGSGGVHAIARLSAGYTVGDHLRETERIVTPGIGYRESGARERTYHDGTLDARMAVSTLQIAGELGLGYEFSLRQRVMLAPRVSIVFPFTAISSDFPAWRVPAVRFILVLRLQP